MKSISTTTSPLLDNTLFLLHLSAPLWGGMQDAE